MKVFTSSVSELSTCQLKLPGSTTAASVHLVEAVITTDSSRGVDDQSQTRVGHSSPDQGRAGLVHGQPQVSDNVEVKVFESCYRSDQRSHHSQVLQPGSNPNLH
ncbi:hypothetical protein ATO49_08690 [Mycolicibacterium fortuitum subsp. fortuitum DSM 46621 = ATCC 6841 = JCM 6387]|nr:hypothetical protein ATO49_08690 [Mycolicibacterium fortuitum subsp. fortuitum DSM 46621 = ATCC 6841 = JCM 6387]